MKNKFLRYTLFLFPFIMWSVPSIAAQWYHVEMIVFEQLDTITDEQWPEMAQLNERQAALNPGMANEYIQPGNVKTLTNSAKRLTRSSHYRVLYHQAWQQPILKKRHAKAVKISSENELIEGTLRLYKSTYLYAAVNLWLMENLLNPDSQSALAPEGENITGIRNPHLKQTRRIKIKRRYFFDHPRMGVLLQLTPIDTPDVVATSTEPSEAFSLPEEATPTVQ